jgi:uncharacterized protein with HEPN domain
MPRSPFAYLADIVEACDAIEGYLVGVDIDTYRSTRSIRAAVEREFILVGEAVASLTRLEPSLAGGISHARRIVDFRNQLAHEYPSINDAVVWAIADDEVPVLREECRLILADRGDDVEG